MSRKERRAVVHGCVSVVQCLTDLRIDLHRPTLRPHGRTASLHTMRLQEGKEAQKQQQPTGNKTKTTEKHKIEFRGTKMKKLDSHLPSFLILIAVIRSPKSIPLQSVSRVDFCPFSLLPLFLLVSSSLLFPFLFISPLLLLSNIFF